MATALDIGKTKSKKEFEVAKDAEFRTFTPKAGRRFTKVFKMEGGCSGCCKNEKVIWEAGKGQSASLVRIKGSKGPMHMGILLSKSFVLLHKADKGKEHQWQDVTKDKHDVSKLRFYTAVKGTYEKIQPDKYTAHLEGLTFGLKMKQGVACHLILFGDNVIYWDQKRSVSGVNLELLTNVLSLRVGDKSENVDLNKGVKPSDIVLKYAFLTEAPNFIRVVKKGNDVVWEANSMCEVAHSVSVDLNIMAIYLLNGEIKHFELTDKWVEIGNPITLDLKVRESTYRLSYSQKDKFLTFTPNQNFLINLVKSENKIWEAEGDDFSSKVVLFNENTLSVFLESDIKHFVFHEGAWKPKANTLTLDLNAKGSTYFMKREVFNKPKVQQADESGQQSDAQQPQSDKNQQQQQPDQQPPQADAQQSELTFTPNLNFLFKSLKQGEAEIWKANDPTEFSNKVIFQEGTYVTVYLVNHDFIHFTKEQGEWKQKPEKIVLDLKESSTYYFNHRRDGNVSVYSPKFDYMFKGVKEGDSTVWNTDLRDEYAHKVLKSDTSLMTFHLNGDVRHFGRGSSGWIERTRVIEVDLHVVADTDAFRYLTGDSEVYLPNSDCLIRAVKYRDKLIWESKGKSEYGIRVDTDRSRILIYCSDGKVFQVNSSTTRPL